MINHFVIGRTLIVTDTAKNDIHGFMPDEVVIVTEFRDEPELNHVALCESQERDYKGVLLNTEVSEV